MNSEQLTFAIDIFEEKIVNLQEIYKEKHKEDFEKVKMDKYINKKLKKEINGLIFLNLAYPITLLNTTEKLKY